nr:hypothetical protein CFP56_25879 [Quercus suber]
MDGLGTRRCSIIAFDILIEMAFSVARCPEASRDKVEIAASLHETDSQCYCDDQISVSNGFVVLRWR